LEDGLLAALQQANALYDRSSAGGEFFQVYSLPLSSGLFFEIVQRKGGYSGYGAANSPVRRTALAALSDRPTALPASRHSQKAENHV
jgi:4-hydroxyphenylpyruvate dioxygenase